MKNAVSIPCRNCGFKIGALSVCFFCPQCGKILPKWVGKGLFSDTTNWISFILGILGLTLLAFELIKKIIQSLE